MPFFIFNIALSMNKLAVSGRKISLCFISLLKQMIQREADVKSKVAAVALTDSVHNVWHQEAGKTIREWMREVRHGFVWCRD